MDVADAPGVIFGDLRGAARDRAVLDVECEIRRLQARKVAMVAAVGARGSFRTDGHKNVWSWLQAVLNSSHASARRTVLVGRMFVLLPKLAAAAGVGWVGDEQLDVLLRLFRNPRCRQMMVEWEDRFVDFAQSLLLSGFAQFCQRWEQAADPDGADQSVAEARAARRLSMGSVGGAFELKFFSDSMSGGVIENLVRAYDALEMEIDIAERKRRWGDDAVSHDLPRTGAQRRADAFMAIMLDAAEYSGMSSTTNRAAADDSTGDADDHDDSDGPDQSEDTDDRDDADADADATDADADADADADGDADADADADADDDGGGSDASDPRSPTDPTPAVGPPPSSGGATCHCRRRPPKPLVNIFCTQQQLEDAIRQCAPGYVESVTVASSKLGWAETASGGLVSRQDLFMAALLGNVRRVVNDSVGRVIDLGRTSRLFTGAAREAVLLGGDRCSFPGDEFRPGRIHIDHTIPWVPRHPWEDPGRTDHDNGGPLCAGHDTAKHDLGITVTRDRSGWHF